MTVTIDLGTRPVVRALGTWDGRTALVTGAATGLGAALARALVARGADVTFADTDARALQRAVDSATGRGEAHAAVVDLADTAALADLVAEVRRRTGRLDHVVAAARADGPARAVVGGAVDAGLAAALAVEVVGAGALAAAAWPLLVAGEGHLALVAHPAPQQPAAGHPAAVAARAAVVAYAGALRGMGGGPVVTLLTPPVLADAAAERLAAGAALDAMAAGQARWPAPIGMELLTTATDVVGRLGSLATGVVGRLRR